MRQSRILRVVVDLVTTLEGRLAPNRSGCRVRSSASTSTTAAIAVGIVADHCLGLPPRIFQPCDRRYETTSPSLDSHHPLVDHAATLFDPIRHRGRPCGADPCSVRRTTEAGRNLHLHHTGRRRHVYPARSQSTRARSPESVAPLMSSSGGAPPAGGVDTALFKTDPVISSSGRNHSGANPGPSAKTVIPQTTNSEAPCGEKWSQGSPAR